MATGFFENACQRMQEKHELVILGITVGVVLIVTVYINLISKIDVVYTHLFYIPIILAAIFYHRKAVYVALFLGMFHISVNYLVAGTFTYEAVLRAVIFLIIAYIIGSIVEKKDQLCDVLKRSEDRLRGMYDTLELRIKERTAELNNANEGLRKEVAERKKAEDELLRSKAQAELYVDIMGHDINNMDQAIMGYLEMVSDRVPADSVEKEYIARSIEMVEKSSRLIDNVKKLQRINAGDVPAQKVDLGKLLSEVSGKYPGTRDRDIKINCSCATGCTVMANSLIKDVFTNIIDNAIKHSMGPLTVNVLLDRIRENSQDYCRVAIEDNGPGLPDAMKKKLTQDIENSDIKAERRGLGVYLVKTLVGRLGGRIRIEDRVPGDYSKGGKFVIMLPACDGCQALN
ncbi:MAG: HAMP domain-containing sensor histidine kinase [Methanocella sp.]